MKKLLVGCGTVLGGFIVLLFVLLFALGMAIEMGYLPDSVTLPKGKIHPRYIETMRQMGVIEAGEEVYYFYSSAFLSIEDDGNLFTDKRVISYEKYEGELTVYDAIYSEIESIEFSESESWAIDSEIMVNKKDGDWFVLYVSSDSGEDERFYKKLLNVWESRKGTHHSGAQQPSEVTQ